jgi:3-hydroxyisobutyrate dehydrogenase-like beta-hydroxyacid dehydrogenase
VPTVGIVSPGAMGSAVGGALLRGGARVVATAAGRSERTRWLAETAGLELVPALDDVVRAADVVLSIVPPERAESVAGQLVGARLLVDLNAVAPDTARRISSEVDGSISGPPPLRPGTTRLYLSGPRAAEAAALPFDGIDVIVVGGEVGAASAVKMSTASVYKGTAGLLAQALRSADSYGVLDHVLADLGDQADDAGRRIARAAAKSERYVGEMREIAAAQAAAGLDPALFEAFAQVYAEIASTPLARVSPEEAGADLADALAQLRR